MKKLFFSLIAAVAVCCGLASCDAAEELIMKKFAEPALSKLAGNYESEDGSSLELTGSGNYIYSGADTTAAAASTRAVADNKVVLTGTFTVESSTGNVILSGDVTGSVDVKNGSASIKVGNKEVDLKANKNKVQVTNEENNKFCRTWNVRKDARVDGKKVTISADEYADYFGSYGYPKSIIISAYGTFCVVCDKSTYLGTWKAGKDNNSLYVEEGTFKGDVPFVVTDIVKVAFSAADKQGKVHAIEAILEEAE